MRWDDLFDDLEGQLEHELNAEETDLRAEEERLRLGRLSLRTRLMSLAQIGGPARTVVIRVALVSGDILAVRPTTFGKDWLAGDLVDTPTPNVQCVMPLASIAGILLSSREIGGSLAVASESSARLVERIGLPFVLRDLCRRRSPVELVTPGGALTGTIDRVGRDHLDLAMHPPGTLRRASEVSHYRIVPLAQISLVRLRSH